MSKIKVNPNLVLKANQKLAKSRETVKSQLMPVKAAHSHLDRRILARRGINGQFNNVHKQFQEIEEKIDTLYNFILHSMQQYSIAEETVNKRVVENNLGTFAIANTLGNTPNYDKMQPSDTPDKKDGSSFSKKLMDILRSHYTSGILNGLSLLDSRRLLYENKDLKFQIIRDKNTGEVKIKLVNKKITNRKDFEGVRGKLIDQLGGSAKKWTLFMHWEIAVFPYIISRIIKCIEKITNFLIKRSFSMI